MSTVPRCFYKETCGGKGPSITIKHVKTGQQLRFPAFLLNFSDDYKAEWKEESVYGRMDPIATYKNTGRKIQLSFKVISTSQVEARSNLFDLSKLAKFHYPSYMAAGNANLIQSPPLLRIKFEPFIMTPYGAPLLGYTQGVNISPNVEAGFIHDTKANNFRMLPKEVEISLNFTVLHAHDLGYDRAGREIKAFGKFPYGVSKRGQCSSYEKFATTDAAIMAATMGIATAGVAPLGAAILSSPEVANLITEAAIDQQNASQDAAVGSLSQPGQKNSAVKNKTEAQQEEELKLASATPSTQAQSEAAQLLSTIEAEDAAAEAAARQEATRKKAYKEKGISLVANDDGSTLGGKKKVTFGAADPKKLTRKEKRDLQKQKQKEAKEARQLAIAERKRKLAIKREQARQQREARAETQRLLRQAEQKRRKEARAARQAAIAARKNKK